MEGEGDAVPLEDDEKAELANAILSVDAPSCELAEGERYALGNIKVVLNYTEGDPEEITIATGASEPDIAGRYRDQYILQLEDENDNNLNCYQEDGLSKGTYHLCLYTYEDYKIGKKIAEASNYEIHVKDISQLAQNTLEKGLSKVSLSNASNNTYVYYKFDATNSENQGTYYLALRDSNITEYYDFRAFYYDEKTGNREDVQDVDYSTFELGNHIYYFVFNTDIEEKETQVDFNLKKEIKGMEVITNNHTSYLDYLEYPLNDWKLKITYADSKEPEYIDIQDLLNKAPYSDAYNNSIELSVVDVADDTNHYYHIFTWGKGTYKVSFKTENTPKVENTVTITMPVESDWVNKNRVLKVGDNTIENTMYSVNDYTYFMFKPTAGGTYIFSDPDAQEIIGDSIYEYNSTTNTFDYYEEEDNEQDDRIILKAKAGTEYIYASDYLYGRSRTITITTDHNHEYTSAITKAPTCTTAGVRTYTCKDGDDSYIESIPATGHKLTTIAGKAATCTEAGLTEGQKCSVCGTVTKAQQTIPATGHKLTTIAGKAATCAEAGLTEGQKCSVCGTVTKAQQTIPALGHSMTGWTTTQEPTVLAEGVSTRTCQRCGYTEQTAIARLAATGDLNATNFPLKVKQSATLRVNNMAAGDSVASWTSSNTKIVTVDGNGKVTGKKKGTATVTATLASGRVLKATVKVQTGNVKTSAIAVNTKNVSLSQGQTFQLTSTIAPFTSKDKLSYKTSNKKVATVSKNGKITAKKAGKATITVKAGKKSVKVKVTVVGVKTTDLSVNATQLNLKVKKKATLKAYVTPKNSSEQVTYKTSNKKVATVDKKGKVTAKKAGTATITVKSGSKSVKVTVVVAK